jgi:hypothetical protein
MLGRLAQALAFDDHRRLAVRIPALDEAGNGGQVGH